MKTYGIVGVFDKEEVQQRAEAGVRHLDDIEWLEVKLVDTRQVSVCIHSEDGKSMSTIIYRKDLFIAVKELIEELILAKENGNILPAEW